jgi:hypothetical protein
MSPSTTPPTAVRRAEADTIKKSRFFEALDSRTGETIRSIVTRYGIPPRTANYWVQQRDIQGSPAYRRTRKLSYRLGRKSKLTDTQL